MKLNKRIKGLERHAFAPELTTLHIGETKLKVKGVKTIKEARASLFKKPSEFYRWVQIKTFYPKDLEWLNRSHSGTVSSYAELKSFMKQVKAGLTPEGTMRVTKLKGVYL